MFEGRIVVIGLGSVSRCTLPLLFEHLQVAASVMAAAKWAVAHPSAGLCLPDDLRHEKILRDAKPYLGPFVSQPVDWTPLKNWPESPFGGYGRPKPPEEDVWQFGTFLVSGMP